MILQPSSAWQRFFFRYRGLSLALLGLIVFSQARPTLTSVCLGLVLGLSGEALRLWAIGFSGQVTRGLEPGAPRLITAGPYSLVRNPLYVGNLLNSMGALLAASGGLTALEFSRLWVTVVSMLIILYSSLITVEEEFLSAKFGQEYLEYYRRVPALFPRAFRVTSGTGTFSWSHGVRWEASTLVWWTLTWALLFGMVFRHGAA